jgi:hypothetical protein
LRRAGAIEADAEPKEAGDQHQVLVVGEDPDLAAEEANQRQLDEQSECTHEQQLQLQCASHVGLEREARAAAHARAFDTTVSWLGWCAVFHCVRAA